MSFGAPTPPSPYAGIAPGQQVASEQQGYNTTAGIQSQAGSMVGQSNPYGTLSYTQTGTGPNGTPIYTANVTASPAQQQLINLLTGNKGVTQQQAGSLLFGANYGGQTPQQAVGNEASGIEGQMMAGYQQEMQPIQQRQRDQLDTQLRNQGGRPGDKGLYDNAMQDYDTNVGNVNARAASDYANQAFGQANTLYQEPWKMAESMMAAGGPTSPTSQFVNAPGLNIQPANLTGAVANAQQAAEAQYKAQMDQYSGMMNGLFGIGADVLTAGLMPGGFMGVGGGPMSYQQYGNGEYYPSYG